MIPKAMVWPSNPMSTTEEKEPHGALDHLLLSSQCGFFYRSLRSCSFVTHVDLVAIVSKPFIAWYSTTSFFFVLAH